MENIKIDVDDYKDIAINNTLVLHINRNDEGYSFDIYNKEMYESDDYDSGFIAGTWFRNDEIEKD
jgi:hypothetical protein